MQQGITHRIVRRETLGRMFNDGSFALKAVADRKPHTPTHKPNKAICQHSEYLALSVFPIP